MHHVTPPPLPAEPAFEAPPLLAAGSERRLTARAALRRGGSHEYRDNALTLGFGVEGVHVVTVGDAVAAAFGLAPGPLRRGDDDLAGRLHDACAACVASGAVVGFEAALRTPASACVLLRGVLLPIRGGAEAVLSWKEVLGREATARLRGELRAAMVPPPGPRPDPFADARMPCRVAARAA
ncbi:hypothetical protein [Glacieibacterium frigidum]|uniref:Uncharacterized protein n=1 Tax=Glacieibacterium frigidum TaxID=2593303 RepID=A0A552U9T0_9SPHN|nr:hypothetical protein [Glacieibacterium frigidum]TRW14965.1 hypothetical protein FMM06_15000 [Glacieibacterium frigidum]